MNTLSTTKGTVATTPEKPHVVIIGAGFGDINAAQAFKNALVNVTVIDRDNHHLFQPLLCQVATAVLSPADISAPIRHVLRKHQTIWGFLTYQRDARLITFDKPTRTKVKELQSSSYEREPIISSIILHVGNVNVVNSSF